jgi:hypothetical protein
MRRWLTIFTLLVQAELVFEPCVSRSTAALWLCRCALRIRHDGKNRNFNPIKCQLFSVLTIRYVDFRCLITFDRPEVTVRQQPAQLSMSYWQCSWVETCFEGEAAIFSRSSAESCPVISHNVTQEWTNQDSNSYQLHCALSVSLYERRGQRQSGSKKRTK